MLRTKFASVLAVGALGVLGAACGGEEAAPTDTATDTTGGASEMMTEMETEMETEMGGASEMMTEEMATETSS